MVICNCRVITNTCSPTHVQIMMMKAHPHDNVVCYHDSHLVGDELWVIMELMDGGALTSILQKSRYISLVVSDENLPVYQIQYIYNIPLYISSHTHHTHTSHKFTDEKVYMQPIWLQSVSLYISVNILTLLLQPHRRANSCHSKAQSKSSRLPPLQGCHSSWCEEWQHSFG